MAGCSAGDCQWGRHRAAVAVTFSGERLPGHSVRRCQRIGRDGTQRGKRMGWAAARQRGDVVRPRGQVRHQRHARSGQAHHRRQAGAHLAQPQQPAGVRGVPAPVPQRVRGSGQHVHDRAAQPAFRFPQRRGRGGRRLGLQRTQTRAARRQAGALEFRASRWRPVDRSHRGAAEPAASSRAGREHHARHRLLQPVAPGISAHWLLRHVPPGRAVVSQDRRA